MRLRSITLSKSSPAMMLRSKSPPHLTKSICFLLLPSTLTHADQARNCKAGFSLLRSKMTHSMSLSPTSWIQQVKCPMFPRTSTVLRTQTASGSFWWTAKSGSWMNMITRRGISAIILTRTPSQSEDGMLKSTTRRTKISIMSLTWVFQTMARQTTTSMIVST